MGATRPELPPALQTSIKMRVPRFTRETPPREKIDGLEDYLLRSAGVQGDLTEERLDWMQKLVPLQHRWDHLEGWEHLRRTRTETAVAQAKRQVTPDLYDEMRGIEWMIKRLTEEIDRMERDASKCSRAYTMITGS